jgi:hypothetical protein
MYSIEATLKLDVYFILLGDELPLWQDTIQDYSIQ